MKKFLVLLLSVFFISSLSSQPIEETNHTNSYIGVVLYAEDNALTKGMAEDLKAYAENRTAVKVAFSENSQYKQNEKINEFFEDKECKAVIVQLVDASSSALILKKAEKFNMPIVFLNSEPHFEAMRQKNNAYFVGASSIESGRLQGKMIAEYWNEHKEEMDKNHDNVLQYFLITGDIGKKLALMRSEYVVNAIIESGIEVERIGKGGGAWTEECGENAINKSFGTIASQLEAVIANTDELALGAVTALKVLSGFGFDMVPVFGIGGIDKAMKSIEAGELTGTIEVNFKEQVEVAYNLALLLASGLSVTEDNIGYPIDKNNAIWIPYNTI